MVPAVISGIALLHGSIEQECTRTGALVKLEARCRAIVISCPHSYAVLRVNIQLQDMSMH